MNLHCKLGANKAFPWHEEGSLSFICSPLAFAQMSQLGVGFSSSESLGEALRDVKGCFSLVLDRADSVVLAADIAAGFPLYYSVFDGKINVSDDAMLILPENPKIGRIETSEYLASTFVSGGDTLVEGVHYVKPGEIVSIAKQDGSVDVENWWLFDPDFSHEAQAGEYDAILLDVFRDLARALDGRQVLIPLSGGLDSRTVAVMLHRVGYENVVCFSYGRRGNFETETARKVAQALGYELHYIEYSTDAWLEFRRGPDWDGFLSYAFQGCRTGCIQPTIAMKELVRRGVVDQGAVVVPGHISYDSLVLEDAFFGKGLSLRKAVNLFCEYECSQCALPFEEKIEVKSKIARVFDQEGKPYDEGSWLTRFQELDWRGTQTAFYNHDVRNYEYFECQWELPFWDIRVANFWKRTTVEQAYMRSFYHEYCERYINPFVGLHTEVPSFSPLDIRLRLAKHHVPGLVKRLGRRVMDVVKPPVPHPLGCEGALGDLVVDGQTLNARISEYSLKRFLTERNESDERSPL